MATRPQHERRSSADLPAYPTGRASHIVRVSSSTLRFWGAGASTHAPLFDPAESSPLTLSFLNLVEAFVLRSIRRVHEVSLQQVRKTLDQVGRSLKVTRPLIHARFRTDGARLFIEHAAGFLEDAEGQLPLGEAIDAGMARIEWGGDVADRLSPWVRTESDVAQPKSIVIDPSMGFGQPTIAGTGIQARIVAERYRGGESVAELAEDYQLSSDRIEDAIRCETSEAA